MPTNNQVPTKHFLKAIHNKAHTSKHSLGKIFSGTEIVQHIDYGTLGKNKVSKYTAMHNQHKLAAKQVSVNDIWHESQRLKLEEEKLKAKGQQTDFKKREKKTGHESQGSKFNLSEDIEDEENLYSYVDEAARENINVARRLKLPKKTAAAPEKVEEGWQLGSGAPEPPDLPIG
jgi:hypothetical protein